MGPSVVGGPAEAGRLLERFWEANAATTLSERATNAWLVALARLEGRVSLPTVSPYAYPDIARAAFTELLAQHVASIGWRGCRSPRTSHCCSSARPTS